MAQQKQAEARYVDYNEITSSLLIKVKEAQLINPYKSITVLKKETEIVPATAKATMHQGQFNKKKLSSSQLVEQAQNGSLMICKYYKFFEGKKEFVEVIATGIALSSDGLCATNYHVLMGLIDPQMKLHPADSLLFAATLKGDIYPIEMVVAYSKAADAALFRINTDKKPLSPIPLGNPLEVGETVHTMTNPDGYLYYYSKGVVARNTANNAIGPMANRMEITADYAKGSSGGPILDNKGNLAGMVSSTHSIYSGKDNNGYLQMVIKTTIPVSSIKALIQ